jgi:membrane protein DedA with SNARE-associated domain
MFLIGATSSAPSPLTQAFLYTVLFLAVTASWAGVPIIGATALGAAAVAASQGRLTIGVVLIVATAAGEVGGLIGYAIGDHWGRQLVDRPGKRQAGRARMLARGEDAYAHWGRLAVFFTPAIISGTAKMRYRQFVVWNFLASLGFALSVGLSSYGVGRVATGQHSQIDVFALLLGLVASVVIVMIAVRNRRRRRQQLAADSPRPA